MPRGWRLAACALIALLGAGTAAGELRFEVRVERNRLHAHGVASSPQHAALLASSAKSRPGDPYQRPAETNIRLDGQLPVGWRLLTDLSLRVAKELAEGQVSVVVGPAASSITIDGATGQYDKVQELLRRLRALRLTDMTLTERLTRIDTGTASFARRCERRLQALSAAGGLSFAQGSTTLSSGARPVIDRLTALLAECPELSATISGHTNALGDPETNAAVSLARAAAVRDELILRGISAERLQAVGLGAQRPLAETDDASARRANRRVELAVWRRQP